MKPLLVRMAVVGAVMAAGAAGAACGGGGGNGPGPTPTQIAKTGGDLQVAPASSALPTALSVIVQDAASAPVAGVTVNWAVGLGGGSVSGPSSVTDVAGIATITRTLGATAGTQTTTATRSGLTGSPLTFTSFSQIQGATQISLSAGDNQTDSVLATLGTALAVLVRDHNNVPVQGVVVNWTAANDTLSAATSTTNASGIATVTLKHGPTVGARIVTAAVTGLVNSPVSFNHTATAGTAASMALNGGDAQGGAINTALPTQHSVIVRDSYNNPKAGVTVTWVLGDGGGSISSTAPVTAANGIAGVTRTLGPGVGTHTDTAKVAALAGSPVVFTATAAPQAAAVTVGGASNVFTPSSLPITSGTLVTWTWAGGIHNVTWGTVPGGATVPPNQTDLGPGTGATYSHTFTTLGVYNYQCTNHINMNGSVTVN